MHRLLSPFYVLNVCVCALYLLPRYWFASQEAHSAVGAEFWARERQVFGLLSLSLAFKAFRRQSWDEWILNSFLYTKALQAWLLYCIDVRICIVFLFICLVCHSVAWPPPYDGPRPYGKPMVPEMFHEQVVAPGGAAGAWVVLFTDATRHDGIAMAPLFAELAGTFGQDRLHFAEVDVVTWPELADHYKHGELVQISISGWESQVPTLILFEGGKEQRRLPHSAATAKNKTRMSRKNIVSFFDLKTLSQTGKTKKR